MVSKIYFSGVLQGQPDQVISSSSFRKCVCFIMSWREGHRNQEMNKSKMLYLLITWGNSRRFATPPTNDFPGNVWGSSAEILYWCRITTHCIWVVLLIGWRKFLTNQKHNPYESSDRLHEYEFPAVVPHTSFHGETVGGVLKCRLFSQAS